MTDSERIEKIIKSSDILLKLLNSKNAGGFFQERESLRILCFDHNDLLKFFGENIPVEELGLFNKMLVNVLTVNHTGTDVDDDIIRSLTGAKEIIKKHMKNKNRRIFYSWQDDLPNNQNRGFIQKSIQSAISELNKENNWDLYIDQDTRGTCGSPDIATTILHKIDNSDVFIADISAVSQLDNKLLPNPNVMFELGYAIKSLTEDKILMVFNESSGDIKNIPFDLGLKRQILYNWKEEIDDKQNERNVLREKIKNSIKNIIES